MGEDASRVGAARGGGELQSHPAERKEVGAGRKEVGAGREEGVFLVEGAFELLMQHHHRILHPLPQVPGCCKKKKQKKTSHC